MGSISLASTNCTTSTAFVEVSGRFSKSDFSRIAMRPSADSYPLARSANSTSSPHFSQTRQKRVCEKCGEEVEFADLAKGYESADGRMAILEKSDFENLPLTSTKAVEVVQFVEASEIDPIAFDKPYYLEAEATGQKPYVLLRNALKESGKVAVVKVALRSREALAVVRVSGDVMVMQTMLWPDEVRDASFAAPPADVSVSKAEGVEIPESEQSTSGETNVVDLVAALRASVEAAKARRAEEEKKAKAG